MSFPTVKSDPYKTGLERRRRDPHLWLSEWWGELTKQAMRDDGTFNPKVHPLSPACVALTIEFNRRAALACQRSGV